MKNIKNVVLDLDDTLTDWNDELYREIVPILNYFKDIGIVGI